jgi:hypothetical protein
MQKMIVVNYLKKFGDVVALQGHRNECGILRIVLTGE